MSGDTIAFAMAAGLVAALNPCGFALLPGYLALVVAGEGEAPPSRLAAVGRALAATAMMAAGFLVVFGSFALILAPFTAVIQEYLPVFTAVIGAALLLLAVRSLRLPARPSGPARFWTASSPTWPTPRAWRCWSACSPPRSRWRPRRSRPGCAVRPAI